MTLTRGDSLTHSPFNGLNVTIPQVSAFEATLTDGARLQLVSERREVALIEAVFHKSHPVERLNTWDDYGMRRPGRSRWPGPRRPPRHPKSVTGAEVAGAFFRCRTRMSSSTTSCACLSQLAQPRFRLLQPVGHAHFSVHRRCDGEVLVSLPALPTAAMHFGETKVAVGHERAHVELRC